MEKIGLQLIKYTQILLLNIPFFFPVSCNRHLEATYVQTLMKTNRFNHGITEIIWKYNPTWNGTTATNPYNMGSAMALPTWVSKSANNEDSTTFMGLCSMATSPFYCNWLSLPPTWTSQARTCICCPLLFCLSLPRRVYFCHSFNYNSIAVDL